MAQSPTHEQLYQAILDGESGDITNLVNQALQAGETPLGLIEGVLNPALKEVGDRFSNCDIYLPELILSAEAMQAAMDELGPHLATQKQNVKSAGRVVMATVQGDIHDIGKNIVCALLKANGFDVLDLGRDVSAATIVEEAQKFKADIIGLSALLSTTMPYCRDTVRLLDELKIRSQFHVFIGGGPANPAYAESIGAVYGGPHAEAAVQSMLAAMGGLQK
jgi:5-methyltetrahydrofolate--homocysteine methyltransferase